MNRLKKYTCLLLLTILFSCMSDDYSKCPPGYTRVRISYDWSGVPATRSGIMEEISNIDLYLFDSNGILVSWVNEPVSDVTDQNYPIDLLVPYGTYQLISWINTEEHYEKYPAEFVEGTTLLSESGIRLKTNDDKIVDKQLKPLLYSCLNGLVLTAATTTENTYIPVILSPVLNTYRLNFNITGGEPGESYELSVTDDNGSYKFDNTIASGGKLHYITSLREESRTILTGSLVVGKLSRDRDPIVRIHKKNSGEVIYETSLIPLILRDETEDNPVNLEDTHVLDINLNITRRPEDPVIVRIGFSWVEADGKTGINSQDVKAADLLVFDASGLFVKHIQANDISPNSSYVVETELPAGSYNWVSWFNLREDYEVNPAIDSFKKGVTKMGDALVSLKVLDGVPQVTSGSPLLYGSLLSREINNLFTGSDGTQQLTIPLIQNTYELHFTINSKQNETFYLLELEDNRGSYDFENSFLMSLENIRYSSIARLSHQGKYKGVLAVERLERGRQPVFVLKTGTGREIYRISLVELILKYESGGGLIDFNKMYRFELELTPTYNEDGSISVEVTINGWTVKDEEGQLG